MKAHVREKKISFKQYTEAINRLSEKLTTMDGIEDKDVKRMASRDYFESFKQKMGYEEVSDDEPTQ